VKVDFAQAHYIIQPGETVPLEVRLRPMPLAGLASFGVKVQFEPMRAEAVGALSVRVNSALAFDGPRGSGAFVASGSDLLAAKGIIAAFDATGDASRDDLVVTFLIKDRGVGPHRVRLGFFNTLGPTEQIFVDGEGSVLDSNIEFGSAEISYGSHLTVTPIGDLLLNLQTGLFEQIVQVTNPGAIFVRGATVAIHDLPPLWRVKNAAGTHEGLPYVRLNTTIAAGQSVTVRIEYLIPNRHPDAHPSYALLEMIPEAPEAPSGNVSILVPRSTLADGSFLLEFSTLSNRVYAIQYSRDLANWLTVLPKLEGNGSRLQWIDYGPPKTERPPGEETNRYYRVHLLP